MADIKWIKLSTDLFNNRKIKQIQTMPEGDAIINIWVQLLCLAGNSNDNGFLYLTKEIPYTEEMLQIEFGRPLPIVKLALITLERFEMIEVIDNVYRISSWDKYQNVDAMDKVREQTRERVAKYRDRKRIECNATSNVTCNVTVTECNATDKEEDIEKEKEKESKEKETPYQLIADMYNDTCVSFPKCTRLSESRLKALKARLKKYSPEDFKTLFEKAEASDFLKGSNSRDWSANFDWLIKDANMAKVLDGNYDNAITNGKAPPGKTHSHNYDFDALEKEALDWSRDGHSDTG